MLAATVNYLSLPTVQKDWEYCLFSVLVSLPIEFTGWLESIRCGDFLIKFGGHVWYEGSIALTSILFFAQKFYRGHEILERKKTL